MSRYRVPVGLGEVLLDRLDRHEEWLGAPPAAAAATRRSPAVSAAGPVVRGRRIDLKDRCCVVCLGVSTDTPDF